MRLEAVTFDVADAAGVAAFSAGPSSGKSSPGTALRSYRVTTRRSGFASSPPPGTEQVGRPWLHLHLTSDSLDHQRRTVELALHLGGGHVA